MREPGANDELLSLIIVSDALSVLAIFGFSFAALIAALAFFIGVARGLGRQHANGVCQGIYRDPPRLCKYSVPTNGFFDNLAFSQCVLFDWQ